MLRSPENRDDEEDDLEEPFLGDEDPGLDDQAWDEEEEDDGEDEEEEDDDDEEGDEEDDEGDWFGFA